MPLTKQEADTQLHKAIVAHAEANGFFRDGELLEAYAVVAHWRKLDGDPATADHYTTHYHVWDIPQHVAVGLLRLGLVIALTDDLGGEDEDE